jgi:hypothetical protein
MLRPHEIGVGFRLECAQSERERFSVAASAPDPEAAPSADPRVRISPLTALRNNGHAALIAISGVIVGAPLVVAISLALASIDIAEPASVRPTSTSAPRPSPTSIEPSPSPAEAAGAAPWPAPDTVATTQDLMAYIESHVISTIDERAERQEAPHWAPIYKPDGYDFWTRAGGATGIRLAASGATVEHDVAQIRAALAHLSFTEFLMSPGNGAGSFRAEYENAGLLCSVSHYGNAIERVATIACADKAAYPGVAQVTAPFFAVYVAATGDPPADMIMDPPHIEPSNTPGYMIAIASEAGVIDRQSVSGGGALFYSTPDGRWHYFESVQSILNCDDYDAYPEEARRAFAGSADDSWRNVPGTHCLDRATGQLAPVRP